jgi:predicted nucleic acid-binding protein
LVILVDTSVWADHFNRPEEHLVTLMQEGEVAMHPFVVGELAIGNLRDWERRIAQLQTLPSLSVVPHLDWLRFVRKHQLNGTGLGFVDAHLLAVAAATPGVELWTRDKRLASAAKALGRGWTERRAGS